MCSLVAAALSSYNFLTYAFGFSRFIASFLPDKKLILALQSILAIVCHGPVLDERESTVQSSHNRNQHADDRYIHTCVHTWARSRADIFAVCLAHVQLSVT